MIRGWSDHEIVISHPPLRRPYSSDLGDDFVLKNTTFRAPAISQNVTKCCACHEKSHSNFTKYCACHAKCISRLIRVSYETSFPMRRASKVNLQLHQILRLPRDSEFKISARNPWIASANIKTIRGHSEDIPRTSEHEIVISHPPLRRPDSSHLGNAFCMKKYNISRSDYLPKLHEMLRLPRKVTLQLHQILRLPRKKMSSVIRVTYETSFPMRGASKVTLQTHQVLPLPRNSEFKISARNPWIASANIKTIRGHSEDIRAWNRHLAPAASETWLVPSWKRILYEKIQHFALRLSPKFARNAVPATKSHIPTSPNTAPGTKHALYSSLYSILSWHLFALGICSVLASILSWHLFSLGIYSLLASILSWHLFSLGIYSLLASILSRHLFSLGIYSLLASILSRHLFSLGIYSL